MSELTNEQKEAIENFAKNEGRIWKSKLKNSWSNGTYPNHVKRDDRAYLQQIRNRKGYDWLETFKI